MESLNTHWLVSLDAARSKTEAWRKDYDEVRPHSAIGNKPPISRLIGSPATPPAWAITLDASRTGWTKNGQQLKGNVVSLFAIRTD